MPETQAQFKALKCLCLLLKGTCQSYPPELKMKQIKDDEVFERWDSIKQYLNSSQGAIQILYFA